MFSVECFFFCPDGITPNSGLTGPNNTIYIYIYVNLFYVINLESHGKQHGGCYNERTKPTDVSSSVGELLLLIF